jgi:hypothetical protein
MHHHRWLGIYYQQQTEKRRRQQALTATTQNSLMVVGGIESISKLIDQQVVARFWHCVPIIVRAHAQDIYIYIYI